MPPARSLLLPAVSLALVSLISATASAQAPAVATTPATAASRPASSKPAWNELTPAQRQALAPLASTWETLNEPHKRKWIALAQNFSRMPPAERDKLHSRMKEWAALSPNQRTQARLNFGETQQLSADEKKAKWEAYQALPPEEKRKLAADAAPRTPATAAAVKPVPAEKLANVPKPAASNPRPARIVISPPGEGASTH